MMTPGITLTIKKMLLIVFFLKIPVSFFNEQMLHKPNLKSKSSFSLRTIHDFIKCYQTHISIKNIKFVTSPYAFSICLYER